VQYRTHANIKQPAQAYREGDYCRGTALSRNDPASRAILSPCALAGKFDRNANLAGCIRQCGLVPAPDRFHQKLPVRA